jgi:tagatose-1,6-bisphosphate aldolase
MEATLQKFQNQNRYLMLAFDHRSSFLKLINPENPQAVTSEYATHLKHEIISSVIDQTSGVLIDPDYGLPAYTGFDKPYLLPLEASGFTQKAGERVNQLLYNGGQLKNWGAMGAKLLLYFNPQAATAAQQMELARRAVADAHSQGLPLFLEIVTYHLAPKSPQTENLVIKSIEAFLKAGILPDVFKLEYPGDAGACQQVTQLLGQLPWILLTRGETFNVFRDQFKIAAGRGCVGFLAGRALWQEVCALNGEDKDHFLQEILPSRFKQLTEISLGI